MFPKGAVEGMDTMHCVFLERHLSRCIVFLSVSRAPLRDYLANGPTVMFSMACGKAWHARGILDRDYFVSSRASSF
jgi:hypothetical protein